MYKLIINNNMQNVLLPTTKKQIKQIIKTLKQDGRITRHDKIKIIKASKGA